MTHVKPVQLELHWMGLGLAADQKTSESGDCNKRVQNATPRPKDWEEVNSELGHNTHQPHTVSVEFEQVGRGR